MCVYPELEVVLPCGVYSIFTLHFTRLAGEAPANFRDIRSEPVSKCPSVESGDGGVLVNSLVEKLAN